MTRDSIPVIFPVSPVEMPMVLYIAVRTHDPTLVKAIKSHLERSGNLNKAVKIRRDGAGFFIPTTVQHPDEYLHQFDIDHYEFTPEDSPMEAAVREHLLARGTLPSKVNSLMLAVPKKWSLYPPLILFLGEAFSSPQWKEYADDKLYASILRKYPNFTHIALNKPIIKTDVMRRPLNITPLYGDFGPEPTPELYDNPTPVDFKSGFWCGVNQNGIDQNWAPLYTMFSRGNVKEKARVLRDFACKDSVVFDLYCGIGYFSLSYLKNGCKNIFCWELNGWSIEGFRRSVSPHYSYQIFGPEDEFNYEIYTQLKDQVRVFIFHESNEHVPRRMATFPDLSIEVTHVNLGLLPSSQGSWDITMGIAKKSLRDVHVHVHENVHISQFDEFKEKVGQKFGPVQWLEKVKTFAPDVWHVVVDVDVKKVNGP
ncbi:uncharacterized protein CANTADRAFT_26226 [Suhomyces tanzawaensis NRRL Y-17324]|uniref:tRNA wybutosine-synthesizing protein 2 n=1 Tax=Suhomyces tanzawaensis NRRL Y-17324 TaxID=984487 RepID=A0A1E4SIG9_9ASCO|nr:uncharacterized protein CANTADRAFT_26226 [Suhomyces tanzawaensis NRRL Y-17324]ODV79232.1 hypothetical protein CANTADRAFT_26226 [Suhomyces tanzawaensis NRRL Y-17324]